MLLVTVGELNARLNANKFRSVAACSAGDLVLAGVLGSRGSGVVFSRGSPIFLLPSNCLVNSTNSSAVRLLWCKAASSFRSSGTI